MMATDNGRLGRNAKIEIRRRVLECIPDARVFDAFAGRGAMFKDVWSAATEYVGCDFEWNLTDPGDRFAADNRRVMRSIDLQKFNLFDFDAYGSPWEQMVILAERRRWTGGELVGIVFTDGTSIKSRFGGCDRAMAKLCGLRQLSGMGLGDDSSRSVQRLALKGWLNATGVSLQKMWRSEGMSSDLGSHRMVYTGMVIQTARCE
jgi:hypothetical protein